MSIDFLAIGDTVVDDFIRLKDARVTCDIDDEACTISMRWGDKIPFESSTVIPGVGNSANAAVAASRLGLRTALVTNAGKDRNGAEIVKTLRKEKLSPRFIRLHAGKKTNYHYVLWFESERTILVNHERYAYALPKLPAAKTLYLSSLGEGTEAYHDAIADYAEAHPDTFVVFQPGTFQMKLGTKRLARLYARADLLVLNKEEAARILGLPEHGNDVKDLLQKTRALGPKSVVITDGRAGAYAFDGTDHLHVPMYPDPRAPFERTGAGDAFTSAVAAAVTLGLPFREALRWGPISSMLVVQDIGAQRGLPSRTKLEELLAAAPGDYRAEPF